MSGDQRAETKPIEERLAILDRLRRRDHVALVSRLTVSIAHELGTPLNVIGGRAMMISSGELDLEEARASARIIHEQVARITAILHRTLAYASPAPGPESQHDLRVSLGRALELVGSEQVRVSIEAGPPVFSAADEDRVLELLTLVLGDAIRAAEPGATLTVKLGRGPRVPSPREQGRLPPGEFAWIELPDASAGGARLEALSAPWLAGGASAPTAGIPMAVAQAILRQLRGYIELEPRAHGPAWMICFP